MKNIIKYFKSCLEPSGSLFMNFYLDDGDFIFNYELNPPIYKFIISDFYFNFIYLYVKDRTYFNINSFSPNKKKHINMPYYSDIFIFNLDFGNIILSLEDYEIFKSNDKVLKL